jgi:sugar phosphate isomerase/epimerase
MHTEPFRIGTSSYIIPDDILPNARFLAGKVRDIELVLFEVDDGQNNLPDRHTLDELIRLSAENDLSYTVHLPLDLRLGADGNEQHISLQKAKRVIETVKRLAPWAYVLHLDGRNVKDHTEPAALSQWTAQALRALEITADWAGDPKLLAVENLEGYPLDFWEVVFERSQVGRCVDVGHLWRDGHDPIPYLARALERMRVIHIHGIAERDHQSLAYVPKEELDRVMHWLYDHCYSGVLTIEIFGEDDFTTSLAALKASLLRTGNQ